MASKIGGVGSSSSTSAAGAGRAMQRPQDAAAGGTQGSGQSAGSASDVQITGTARQLANLEQVVRDLPVVNDAKVAQISSAIEQGTYSVNSQHIADKLIQTERELSRIPNGSDAEPDADTAE